MAAAPIPAAVEARVRALHEAGQRPRVTGASTVRLGGDGNRGGTILSSRGRLTPAGRAYAQAADTEVDAFDRARGLVDEGDRSYAFLQNGRRVTVRFRRDGDWVLTNHGKAFFQGVHTEYIIEVPYVVLKINDKRDPPRYTTYLDPDKNYMPLIAGTLTGFVDGGDWDEEIRSVRRREDGSEDADRAINEIGNFVRQTLEGGRPYFTVRQMVERNQLYAGPGLEDLYDLVVLTRLESDRITLWDPLRPFHVDKRETRVGHGVMPDVNVILDRPLLGKVACPDEFYAKYGLHPTALEDTGECVLQQFVVCARKRGQGKRQRDEDGKVTRPNVWRPIFTVEEAVAAFDEAFQHCHPAGEWPYDFEGAHWRTAGVTCRMLQRVCENFNIALYVMHLDHLVYRFLPPGYTPENCAPSVALNVWGDHAFFYDHPDAKLGIAKMKPMPPAPVPQAKLRDFEQQERIPFDSMKPFVWADVEEAVENGRSANFRARDIKSVLELLEASQYTFFKLYGSQPNEIVGYCVRPRRQPRKKNNDGVRDRHVVIRQEPEGAPSMNEFCKILRHTSKIDTEYRGESASTLCMHIFNELLFRRRMHISEAVKDRLRASQDGMCAVCCDPLGSKNCEIDHRIPLHRGGADHESNLQILCKQCHGQKSDEEHLSPSTARSLESRFSPAMFESFHNAPKPRQLSTAFGDDDGECVEVKDPLKYYHFGFDVVGCRSNALLESKYDLPVYCPLDEPEALPTGYKPGFDFYRVNDCVSQGLWSGDRWYWCETVECMLELGVVLPSHVVLGFKASQHISVAKFAEAAKTIKQAWDDLDQAIWCQELQVIRQAHGKPTKDVLPQRLHGAFHLLNPENVHPTETGVNRNAGLAQDDLRNMTKKMLLSFVGLCNRTQNFAWSTRRTTVDTDVVGPVERKRYVGEGIWEMLISTEIKGLSSLRPIGQIALDMEQTRVYQALNIVARCPDVRLLGINVDCVIAQDLRSKSVEDWGRDRAWGGYTGAILDMNSAIEAITYPRSGDRVFREVVRPFVPSHIHVWELRNCTFPERHTWRHERNHLDPDALAKLILENGGTMITGPPGVGKTHLMRRVVRILTLKGLEVFVISYTHSASRLVGGDTILHKLHSCRRPRKDTWIIIDEASQVHTNLWASIAEYQLLGCRFIIMGDFKGQYLPIGDPFAALLEGIEDSSLMHSLCGGLHVHLSQNHRCKEDPAHFDFYCSIYDMPADDTLELARAMTVRFPPKDLLDDPADHYLCLSHATRIRLNAFFNDRARGPGSYLVKKVECPGAPTEPQDMWLCVGMELLGCVRQQKWFTTVDEETGEKTRGTILHGCVYKVVNVTERFVEVEMNREFWKPVSKKLQCQGQAPADEDHDSDADDEFSDDEEDGEDPREYPGVVVLGHEDASKYLRLRHALTYASVQGLTMRDKKVVMLDMARLTMRHLMVASSRVTAGRFLRCASPAAQNRLLEALAEWESERAP